MNNNSYPNAASGMKKVFTSEILDIIAAVPLFIAVVLSAVAIALGAVSLADNSLSGSATGVLIAAAVLFIIFAVIKLIAFILQLVGLSRAGRDHIYFKYAFGLVFIGILLTIGTTIFGRYILLSSLLGTAAECVDVVIMIFVVYGCMTLLNEKGNEAMVYNGYTVVNLMILINMISVIARLVPAFFSAGVIGTIFTGFYLALTIVSGIMFLVFLKKASKALAE